MTRWSQSLHIILVSVVGVTAANATEPDWDAMVYTGHSAFQAVDGQGFGTFPMDQPIRMRGVLLNRSARLLDPQPGAPGFLGGLWQVYVRTADDEDFGGTALWMGQYLGRMTGNHPAGSYSDAEWLDELERLSTDPDTGRLFQVGDLVEIRARAPGLHFRGKSNVNEQHVNVPEADFDIHLIEADHGLPLPTEIALSELKNAANEFIFDDQRLVGAEHYQGSMVRINDVAFVDTNGWGSGGAMIIEDQSGRTLPVLLALGAGFDTFSPPPGPFDIIGLLDQEDEDAGDGLTNGYRLWVVDDYDGNGSLIPSVYQPMGDANGDGDVDLVDYTAFTQCLNGPNVTPTQDCLDAFDFDEDGDVDLRDMAEFQDGFTGVTTI